MIAAISNTGTLRFRVFEQRFTGPLFLDFLKRLVKDAKGRKVVIILDGHPAHRARVVRDWVAANSALIELHFLPGYSPELNPAECLNQDVKTNALGKRRPTNNHRAQGRRPRLSALRPAPPGQGRPLLPRAPRHLRRSTNYLTLRSGNYLPRI